MLHLFTKILRRASNSFSNWGNGQSMTDRKHNCQKKKEGRKTVYHKTQYMKTIDPAINRSEQLFSGGEESFCSAIDKLSIEIKNKIHYK